MLDAITATDTLKGSNPSAQPFATWQRTTANVLLDCFGQGSVHVTKFLGVSYVSRVPLPPLLGVDDKFREEMRRLTFDGGLNEARGILVIALRDLTHFAEVPDKNMPVSNKVFVVHGHDDGLRESVARFLERQDLEAIILQEQANGGRTLIEKFEQYSDVAYAIVLMTPDDVAASKADPSSGQDRARQNVIFELGYFVGQLKRGRVALLRKGRVEMPSDLQGIVYISVQLGDAWKYELAKELQEAGLKVDRNRI